MEYISVIILAVIVNASHEIEAKLNVIPRNTEVMVNDSTYLNCSTSLRASHVHWLHEKNYVYTAIGIFERYAERFSVEINASTGACNLVIGSVQTSDAGTYKCLEDEGFGEQRSVQLIVVDNDPVCRSNMHSDGVIGPNSCGIEPEEVRLSCSIEFHGKSLPVLQWKASGDNQSIADGLIDINSIKNEVTYSLTMKSTLGLNNTSYICQTTRTSNKHYSCSSDVINILYVFSSEVTANMTVDDEVICIANTSQSCSYKWKWFNGDDSTTESDNQNLKPKKGGMHRCEATCSIRNESCSVQSMRAKVYLEEATSGQHLMPLLVLLLAPALVAFGVSVYCWKKRKIKKARLDMIDLQKREVDEQQRSLEVERRRLEEIELQRREEEERQRQGEEERLRSLGLIATIRTKAAEERNKEIRGLTIVDNELFVVCQKSSEVEVYDSAKFSFSRQWTLNAYIDPLDVVSCHINKCLYISDIKVSGLSNEIFKIGLNGKLLKKWSTKLDCGRLSVTYDSNVILAVFHENKLNEYFPDGQFIREIHLSLSSENDFCHPLHAIKLTNGHFVVSHGDCGRHGDCKDDLHRVCIVDADGKLLKSFGEKHGPSVRQTHAPKYLSVNGSGSVMVADCHNNRVLLLDSDLKFKRQILTEEHGLQYPMRIILDECYDRIFVADSEPNNSRILIFDLCRLRSLDLNDSKDVAERIEGYFKT